MRKSLIAALAAMAALIVAVVVAVSGAIPLKSDGQAVASAPTRAENTLNTAVVGMANAPGAEYTGDINTGDLRIGVKDFEVTAAGDAHGLVNLNGQVAEVMQISGSTYVKAGGGFWDSVNDRNAQADRSVRKESTGAAGRWALAPEGLFGMDLGKTLRPATFAMTALDTDGRLPAEGQTRPASQSDQGPDRRGESTVDPTGLEPGPVEDDGQTIRAGENPIRVNADGSIYGIAGPVRNAASEQPTTTKLLVTLMSNDGVQKFYSTVQGLGNELSKVPAPAINIPKPSGSFTNCTNTYCLLVYNFTNTMPGADRGTVRIQQTSNATVNGVPVGTCTRVIEMPMNGNGKSECPFVFANPGNVTIHYNAQSQFQITAQAEKDVQIIIESAEKGKAIATTDRPGQWTPSVFRLDPNARKFNQKVTGTPSGFSYVVGGFPFDGREPDGTLVMSAAPGYAEHVGRGGTFDQSWPGTGQMVKQATDAARAANGAPLRWVFAEGAAASAARKLLADNNITGVEVVSIPPAG